MLEKLLLSAKKNIFLENKIKTAERKSNLLKESFHEIYCLIHCSVKIQNMVPLIKKMHLLQNVNQLIRQTSVRTKLVYKQTKQ